MDKNDDSSSISSDQYFGRLLIAMELRRTHGMVYAVFFLEEFEEELYRAVATNSILSARDLAAAGQLTRDENTH